MKKIAIFVEGATEVIFFQKLLKYYADDKSLIIEICQQNKGFLRLEAKNHEADSAEWFILIANCCNDEQVKTQIIESYSTLVEQGFSHIIGIRDVFPFSHAELNRLMAAANEMLPIGSITISMHFAIMEIEAWFIEEHSHFERIDSSLTAVCLSNLGFVPNVDLAEAIVHPAKLLHEIYSFVGKAYKKKKHQVQRTVEAIDYAYIRGRVRSRSASLHSILLSIEAALQ